MSETVVVADPQPLTPSPAPPAETSAPAPFEWDREAVVALARQWYEPLARPEGWLAVAYLLLGVITSAVFFVAALALAAIVFGLTFAGIGLLLVVPWFAAVGAFARAERAMAGWVDVPIPERPTYAVHGVWIGALRRAWSDAARWRQVAFIAANVLVGPVFYAIGVLPYAVVAQLAFGANVVPFWNLHVSGGGLLLSLPVIALLLAAGPRVAIWVARRKAAFAAWFLGPDRLAEAEQRVSALKGQREDILDAVARERRRIERNLHDGVQQQLVAIGLDLAMAAGHLDRDPERARELVLQARDKVQGSIGELRQLGRGLRPAILEDRGVDAALSAIVAGAPIPISVRVEPDLDLDTDVAETVYFIANEAIANILKHARARVASVHVIGVGDRVRVTIHDDGSGGADVSEGTGLAGMRARVHGVDGTLTITSPRGGPTTITAELPRHG
jgi:signal transduction histidine kinase